MALEFEKQKEGTAVGYKYSFEAHQQSSTEKELANWQPNELVAPETAHRAGWVTKLQDHFNRAVESCRLLIEREGFGNSEQRIGSVSMQHLSPAQAAQFCDVICKIHPNPIELLEKIYGYDINRIVKSAIYFTRCNDHYDFHPEKLKEHTETMVNGLPDQLPQLLVLISRCDFLHIDKLTNALQESGELLRPVVTDEKARRILLRPAQRKPDEEREQLLRPSVSPAVSKNDPLAELGARGNRRMQLIYDLKQSMKTD